MIGSKKEVWWKPRGGPRPIWSYEQTSPVEEVALSSAKPYALVRDMHGTLSGVWTPFPPWPWH